MFCMKVFFCRRWPQWLCASFLFCLFSGTVSGECFYLPPCGPMAFGFFEVARSGTGDSPLWMDDGRIIVGSDDNGGAGYRRGAIYVYPKLTSTMLNTETIIYPNDPQVGVFGHFGLRMATSGSWIASSARRTNDQWVISMIQATEDGGFAIRTNLVGTGVNAEQLGSLQKGFSLHGSWLAALRYGSSRARIFMYRVNEQGLWEMKQEIEHPQYPDELPNTSKVDLFERTMLVTSSQTDRADVWRLGDDDVWAYETQLIPPGVGTGVRLGEGLEVAQDRIFLGAPDYERTASSGGAVFIFKRANGLWAEESRILSSSLTSTQFIGSHVAYSKLAGEWLATADSYHMVLFKPNAGGTGWEKLAKGRQGRFFQNWESPAGNFQSYGYGSAQTPVRSLTLRGYQALAGYGISASMMEYGLHAIKTFRVASDPECMTRPLYYLAIGAPRDDADKPVGDSDNDGVSDIGEIYFGTYMDATNTLSSGLKASFSGSGERKVQWPRLKEPALLVKGRAEWSADLTNWTTNGITEVKVGEDAAGREIMETTLPSGGATAYLRLMLTATVPESQ
jgi:hypothetical protein